MNAVAVSLEVSVWRRRHVTECFLFPDDPVQSSPLESTENHEPLADSRELTPASRDGEVNTEELASVPCTDCCAWDS